MDVPKLRQLASVVKLRSFSQAAEALGISQPALSKNIKALERSLGVRLLERGRFGATPTDFGLALAQRADAIEAELRIAEDEIATLRAARKGRLCIGCGPSEATRLLPRALARLRMKTPAVHITVLYGLNEALIPMVKHGDVDFALSSIPARSADPELRHTPIYEDTAVIVARYGHPLAALRRSLVASDLIGREWILARRQELERAALDEVLATLGAPAAEGVIETTSAVLMKTLVMQSDYLTFLPRELIYWEEQSRQLRALRVDAPGWHRVVGVTARARGRLSQAAEAMIEELKATARDFA